MKRDQNTKNKDAGKRIYKKPAIERVKMDYQLSLVMMTDPPFDPPEYFNPGQFGSNPFKFPKI